MADSRSLSCNGVGAMTPEIRFAAASMSAAVSGPSRRGRLGSADTDQWSHAARSVHAGEDENWNLPVGLLLVVRVVGPRLDGTFPPGGLLVAEDLAGLVVVGFGAVLQLHPGVRLDVVVPDRV